MCIGSFVTLKITWKVLELLVLSKENRPDEVERRPMFNQGNICELEPEMQRARVSRNVIVSVEVALLTTLCRGVFDLAMTNLVSLRVPIQAGAVETVYRFH